MRKFLAITLVITLAVCGMVFIGCSKPAEKTEAPAMEAPAMEAPAAEAPAMEAPAAEAPAAAH